MRDRTYRVGLVGLRGIAANSAVEPPAPFRNAIGHSHAAGLSVSDRFDVVAVCDLVPELLDEFERTWGKRWPDVGHYTDFSAMLRESNLDILGIATTDDTHADLGIEAAKAGVKGIFCEKPFATSLEDVDRIIQACEDNGVVITVEHTRRYLPMWIQAREEIRRGAIGNLTTMVGTLGGPRAMLFRNGTHIIDAICMYAESEPTQVWARLEEGFEEWDRYKGDGGKLPENEPGAMGFIQFENGVRALYCGMKETQFIFSLQLSGPDGQIYVTSEGATVLSSGASGHNAARRRIVPGSYVSEDIGAGYEELADLIENGGEGVSMAREARKTVKVLTGFLASQQAGSALIDLPE